MTLTAKSGDKVIEQTTITVIGTDTDYVEYTEWRLAKEKGVVVVGD